MVALVISILTPLSFEIFPVTKVIKPDDSGVSIEITKA